MILICFQVKKVQGYKITFYYFLVTEINILVGEGGGTPFFLSDLSNFYFEVTFKSIFYYYMEGN